MIIMRICNLNISGFVLLRPLAASKAHTYSFGLKTHVENNLSPLLYHTFPHLPSPTFHLYNAAYCTPGVNHWSSQQRQALTTVIRHSHIHSHTVTVCVTQLPSTQ
jgi:hypothetical protein